MNKEEAIQELQNQARHHCGETECYKDGCKKSVELSKAIDIVSCIDEPQKVVIPKFIANWIEHCRNFDHGLKKCLAAGEARANDCDIWVGDNEEKIARAWLYGYEIEPEKLYTVEIPNPNIIGNEVSVLMKNGFKQIVMLKKFGVDWKKERGFQLTEDEIKKDFAWAWDAGFAEGVKDEPED